MPELMLEGKQRGDWASKDTAEATSVVMKGAAGMLDWRRVADSEAAPQGISDLEKTQVRAMSSRWLLLPRSIALPRQRMQGPQGKGTQRLFQSGTLEL